LVLPGQFGLICGNGNPGVKFPFSISLQAVGRARPCGIPTPQFLPRFASLNACLLLFNWDEIPKDYLTEVHSEFRIPKSKITPHILSSNIDD
jgi:hypothetical protein